MESKIAQNGGSNTRLIQGNTHSDTPLVVHLDYLSIRCCVPSPIQNLETFLNFCLDEYLLSIGTYWSDGSPNAYDNKIVGTHGVVGGFRLLPESNLYEISLRLPGSFFASMPLINQWRLVVGLHHRYNCVCTRMDIAIDDSSYELIPLQDMKDAFYRNDIAGFRTYKNITESKWTAEGLVSAPTDYFGSRNSIKIVRVYEHKDSDFASMRFEAEFHKQASRAYFWELALLQRPEIGFGENSCKMSDKDFEIVIAKHLAMRAVGAIDFVNKSEHQSARNSVNKGDCKRLEFYQKFIDLVGGWIRPPAVRIADSTIEKTMLWLHKQVATTMAIVRDAIGAHKFRLWADEVAMASTNRMQKHHQIKSNSIKKRPQLCKLAV